MRSEIISANGLAQVDSVRSFFEPAAMLDICSDSKNSIWSLINVVIFTNCSSMGGRPRHLDVACSKCCFVRVGDTLMRKITFSQILSLCYSSFVLLLPGLYI
jgi:hypothetical protein